MATICISIYIYIYRLSQWPTLKTFGDYIFHRKTHFFQLFVVLLLSKCINIYIYISHLLCHNLRLVPHEPKKELCNAASKQAWWRGLYPESTLPVPVPKHYFCYRAILEFFGDQFFVCFVGVFFNGFYGAPPRRFDGFYGAPPGRGQGMFFFQAPNKQI